MKSKFLLGLLLVVIYISGYGQAKPATYLNELKTALQQKWPENRTINIVFHGHSVPTGYFRTPEVHTLQAYPHLLLEALKKKYPFAVINCITTSIGGENAPQGARRFKKQVLNLHPDLLFIDYALNDRAIGQAASEQAMEKMIRAALKKGIKVILMTPSPDLTEDIQKKDAPLESFTAGLYRLADKYKIGIADSYRAFRELVLKGDDLKTYMAQSNHPNEKGHQVILEQILPFFQ